MIGLISMHGLCKEFSCLPLSGGLRDQRLIDVLYLGFVENCVAEKLNESQRTQQARVSSFGGRR